MNDRRIADILLLLRSRKDYDYEPETWTGKLQRRATLAGPAPSKRVKCKTCSGEGWHKVRGFKTWCRDCGGDPHIAKPGRGWIEVDSYTGQEVGSVRTAPVSRTKSKLCSCGGLGVRPRTLIEIDAGLEGLQRCEHCEGTGRVDVPISVLTPLGSLVPDTIVSDPVLAMMERRSKAGSYDELDACMARLRLEQRRSWCHLRSGTFETLAGEFGLFLLNEWMPDPIRVPRAVREADENRRRQLGQTKGRGADGKALAARNEEIRRLRAALVPISSLMQMFQLARTTVYQIVREQDEIAA